MPSATLDPESLPAASLEAEAATSICDPEPSQFDPGAGDTDAFCYDASLLGLRALHTVVDSVRRLYVRRSRCSGTGTCTATELNVVRVTGWSGSTAWTTTLDYVDNVVTVPVEDPGAIWPAATLSDPPAVARPEVAGAPAEVRDRAPYPFCGHLDDGPPSAAECFRSGVLAGRPVEVLDTTSVSRHAVVIRFDGHGLVHTFGDSDVGWYRSGGSFILGVAADQWSLDTWIEREPIQ